MDFELLIETISAYSLVLIICIHTEVVISKNVDEVMFAFDGQVRQMVFVTLIVV